MKLKMIINLVIFLSLTLLGSENSKKLKAIALPIGLKSDGSIESNRLISKLASQRSFSISLKNRSLNSMMNELDTPLYFANEIEKALNDIPASIDFEINEKNALETLDRILAINGVFGTIEKGVLKISYSGYRC